MQAMVAPGRLRRLRDLSLSNCGSNVGDGSFLGQLPALRSLGAAYCRSLREAPLLAAAPALTHIDLTGASDDIGDALCGALGRAESAALAFLPVSDAGLLALAAAAPRLRRLTLARRSHNLWSTGLWRDEGIAALRRLRPEIAIAFQM